MRRPGTPANVGGCLGGDIVRVEGGIYRLTARHDRGDRWAIELGQDLGETPERRWLERNEPVLELLHAAPKEARAR